MKIKKLTAFVMSVLMLLCGCLTAYSAEENSASLTADYNGSGSQNDPYLIEDADDFIAFTNALNSGEQYKNKYFRQTVNIDLSGRADYVGCTSNGSFYGVYDGNGNTINIALNTTSERNIFPYVYGMIMNLGTTGTLTNTGANYTVGIARSIRTGAVMANCYSTMNISGNKNMAGLVASGNGTLINCYFAGSFSNGYGIAASSSGGIFTNCFYTVGGVGSGVTGVKSITVEELKTTLASKLNEGRSDAAADAGVSLNDIWGWVSDSNGFPVHGESGEGIGSGTKEDPYIIDSADDFISFTDALIDGEQYKNKYFRQDADIDLSDIEDYIGVPNSASFYGFYNGNGKTINVDFTAPEERNIFPYVYGTIINLGTTGAITNTGSSSGYTVGIARSVRTGGVLANSYSTVNLKSNSNTAGLCGSGNGTIVNCYFAGTLTGSSKYAIAASAAADAEYRNCYYTVGNLCSNAAATKITENEAKTTLASSLNEGRAEAAAAAGVEKKAISVWKNNNSFAEHYIPKYDEITPAISASAIEAGNGASCVITTDADYVGEWVVELGNTDAKYEVSSDNKTLTITSGSYAGVVTVRAYSVDELVISNDIKIIIHSGKKGRPGLNMLNGLDCAVDFEDGISYGIKNAYDKEFTVGNIPQIDYSACADANGNAVEALQNTSSKAIVTDGSALHAGDAWYIVIKTSVSGLENGRGYSAYTQLYTNSTTAEKSYAYFNNFKSSNGAAPMTVTFNSRTNTWKEYSYTSTYEKNSTASPAFNTRQEAFDSDKDSTITAAAIDNMYIIPHYNITYHYPDGTTETIGFNPVISENPLKIAKDYIPERTYEEGNYLDSETGKYSYYSGLWATSENGAGCEKIPLENEDVHLYPEKLADGLAVFFIDSLESKTVSFNENVTVTDTYNAANITGNGTQNVTISGKGYNGTLEVKSEGGEVLAYVYLTGTHKWRPGLNIFTGTPDAHDIEADALFNPSSNLSIVVNPLIDGENGTSRVLKISAASNYSSIEMNIEQPIEWSRPFRIDYDYMGKLRGAFWNMTNTVDASGILSANTSISSDKWSHLSQVLCGLGKVSETEHPELNKFVIQTTGKQGDNSYAMYIDDFSIIPSYKVEFFDEKGNKIDKTFYYPRRVETSDYFFSKVYTVDFNPNANYIVNGTPVVTNGIYNLNYEDLKITVLPNTNAVMFSGDNATTFVPEGDTYVIPNPHELPGFTAEDFIVWEDKDGNVIKPGTVVKTCDITGTTLYAKCDASAFTRKPVNGAVVNFGSEQYNNWLANYQISSMIARSDGTYEKEKGVVFSWTAEENAESYTVLYSRNKDMSGAVSLKAAGTTATAYSLFAATDYYWQIKTAYKDGTQKLSEVWKFTTADIHRILPEINNFRDAGGRLTEDGKYRMKQGVIYRGQAVSSGNRASTDKYDIVADLDLRGAETGWITESPLGSDIVFTIIEGTHYYGDKTSVKHYANAVGQARFGDEIRFFTDPSHYPMYFHCAGGRDRTGMLAYIIGGICGVPEEDLFRDYELTWLSANTCGYDEAKKLSVTWMKGFTAYINKNFEGETFKEKMEGYVRLCGVTDEEMDQIRAILLEETNTEQHTETQITKYPSYVKCDVSMTGIPLGVVLLVSGYYDGRLVFDENRFVTKDSESFEVTGTVDEIKVFVFEDAKSMRPLTECEIITVE